MDSTSKVSARSSSCRPEAISCSGVKGTSATSRRKNRYASRPTAVSSGSPFARCSSHPRSDSSAVAARSAAGTIAAAASPASMGRSACAIRDSRERTSRSCSSATRRYGPRIWSRACFACSIRAGTVSSRRTRSRLLCASNGGGMTRIRAGSPAPGRPRRPGCDAKLDGCPAPSGREREPSRAGVNRPRRAPRYAAEAPGSASPARPARSGGGRRSPPTSPASSPGAA